MAFTISSLEWGCVSLVPLAAPIMSLRMRLFISKFLKTITRYGSKVPMIALRCLNSQRIASIITCPYTADTMLTSTVLSSILFITQGFI